MFLTGTAGIIIGGPIAILIVSIFSPETVGGNDFDAVWRGLATIAGSWIGGGANQAAMLEVFSYNPKKFGDMVLVDIVVANIWMAIILLGIGKSARIDKWLKSDTSSIETLKTKVSEYTAKITRITTLNDYIILLSLSFTAVGIAHFVGSIFQNFCKKILKSYAIKKKLFPLWVQNFYGWLFLQPLWV